MYEFQYSCVGCNEEQLVELEFLIDNMEPIENEEFRERIGEELYQTISDQFGYGDWLRLEDDWAVSYYYYKNNTNEYLIFQHSAIEYVYVNK